MKKILCVLVLVLTQAGCVYRIGPFVRDARMVDGELEIERCEILFIPVFGGELREECNEGTRRH